MAKGLFENFSPVSTAAWLQKISEDLKGKPVDKLRWQTEEGIEMFPIAREEDLPEGIEGSFPGLGDLRRGHKALMHANTGWEIHQEANLLAAEDLAKMLASGLEVDALRLQFPEGPGIVYGAIAADQNSSAENHIFGGPVGPDFLRIILRALKPATAIWLEPGLSAMGAAAMLGAATRAAGLDGKKLKGGVGNDPLGQLHWNSTEPGVAKAVFEDAASVIHYLKQHFPEFCGLRVSLSLHHRLGATKAQQIAFALAMAVDMADKFEALGFSAEEVFSTLCFEFQLGTDFFAEIAKLRAFRVLFVKVLDEYKLKKSASSYIQMHVSGSTWRLPTLDAHTNLLRLTTEAMSAVFGGCDSLSLPTYNRGTHLLDPDAIRIAKNIHLVLKHEAYLDKVIDPVGGAYAVESLTQAMMGKAWEIFLSIEEGGGYLAMLQTGKIQEWTDLSGEKREAKLNKGKDVLLGVNRFPNADEKIMHYGKAMIIPHQTEMRTNVQRALNTEVRNRVSKLEKQFFSGSLAHSQGWWDFLIHLRNGRPRGFDWRENPPWAGMDFEVLRHRLLLAVKNGELEQPKAFLFTWGNFGMRKARANFAMNLLNCGGITSIENPNPDDMEAGMAALREANPALIVLCSSNEAYSAEAKSMLRTIKQQHPDTPLIMAGKPENWQSFQEQGLNDCIFAGMDMLEWLQDLMEVILSGKEANHEA